MFQGMAQHRAGMRLRDMAESKQLLWELTSYEPTVMQCFGIVESVCLSHGVHCKIDSNPVTEEFNRFLQQRWAPFLRDCIRCFFTYGFVPWTVSKDSSGEEIPEVLPSGIFDWWIEPTAKDPKSYVQETNPGLLSYRVRLTSPMSIKDSDVHIYKFRSPTMQVSCNSFLSATVPSPMCHVLTDYKHLRQAQLRRSYADSWNTTAKLICSFKPPYKVQEDPSSSLMDFADESYFDPSMNLMLPGIAPLQATNMWTRDAQIRKQFTGVSVHEPDIFTLPKDHDVSAQPMLTPCEDIDFLMAKFQRDVCAIVGVPEEMVLTRTKARMADTVHRTLAAGKIFSSNMKQICDHLKQVAADAYRQIYSKQNAEFCFAPMPRLEVEKIDDLKVLYEIGAITPDVSIQLTELLMGDEIVMGRKRMQLEQEERVASSKRRAGGRTDEDGNTALDSGGLRHLKTKLQGSPKGAKGEKEKKAPPENS